VSAPAPRLMVYAAHRSGNNKIARRTWTALGHARARAPHRMAVFAFRPARRRAWVGLHLMDSMPFTHVLAVDLNWGEANRRVAVALCDPDGSIELTAGDRSDATVHNALLRVRDDARVLVLLDVPIEGLAGPLGTAARPVDRAMASIGIAALPASGAGLRGVRLRDSILARAAERACTVAVREMYPYAIYKVLAYLEHQCRLDALAGGERHTLLDSGLGSHPHPRYKRRERDANRRWDAIRYLYGLLTAPALGLTWRSLPSPDRVRGQAEDHLVDLYDAALGGVLGALLLRGSPYPVLAGNRDCGEMALLADAWAAGRLAERLPVRPLADA
jgi:predicted nuclease with RNAse H fold